MFLNILQNFTRLSLKPSSRTHFVNEQTHQNTCWIRKHLFFENCFFSLSQFRKELWKASTFFSFNSVTYSWSMLQFNFKKQWAWKISVYLAGLGLNLWYIGLGLEKYLSYLTGIGLTLWYLGARLGKYSDYFTGFGLILCIEFGLEKHFD